MADPRVGDLRIRWSDTPRWVPMYLRAETRLMVQEFDDVLGWINVCPLVDFPSVNPSRVDDLPSAHDKEVPPWN